MRRFKMIQGFERMTCPFCCSLQTMDGHDSYLATIKQEIGENVFHRTNRHLNNLIEQDHRGIEQRCRPTCGFDTFDSTARFCRLRQELRNFLQAQNEEGVRDQGRGE